MITEEIGTDTETIIVRTGDEVVLVIDGMTINSQETIESVLLHRKSQEETTQEAPTVGIVIDVSQFRIET